MAGVESIQCPKCGSPLEVTRSTLQARCSYCGSMLRVSRDASGQPLAVLDDIREDTDILATDVVRRRLEERLRERLAARHNLLSAYAAARKKTRVSAGSKSYSGEALLGAMGGLLLLGIMGVLLAENVLRFWFWGVLLGAAIAVNLEQRSRRAALARVEKEYGAYLRALEADVAEARRQLEAATARMDGLIMDAGGH